MEEKHYCRNCAGIRNHKLLFEKKITGGDDIEYSFSFIDKYQIVECSGCGTISFVNIYGDESMWKHNDINGEPEYYVDKKIYPPYLIGCKSVTNIYFIPKIILNIYNETLDAIKSNCFLLAAGGFRAVIEAICKDLKIGKTTLEQKIDELHNLGHLTINESKRLHSVRFLGNDSLHEMQKPNISQLSVILDIINHLLNNLYIQDQIIEGRLDVIIRDYEKFKDHLYKLLAKETISTKKTLLEILGKTKRVISKGDITRFESQLKQEILSGEYSYLSNTGALSQNRIVYEVISIPKIPTFF